MEYEEEKATEQQGQEDFHESQKKKNKGLFNDFMKKKQGKKSKAVKTKNPIITKIKIIGYVITAVIAAFILFAGFHMIVKADGEENVNDAAATAISTSYSTDASTTETDEDGNTVNKVVVTTNESKTGYQITYNGDPEYLEDIRDTLEDGIVDSASDFTDSELAVIGALIDNGANLEYYDEEELKCFSAFMKAEACTQNLDLRKNTEKFGNKEQIADNYIPQKVKDLEDNEVPGTILVQRTNTNGTTTILEYMQQNDFEDLMKDPKNNENAKNYFTINEKGNLVIAKWNHILVTVDGEYPESVIGAEKDTEKNDTIVTPEEIPYNQYISDYIMPFEFLVQLLVITEEPDFCMELVDHVLDSKIVINILEEETVTVTDEDRYYTVHSKDEKYIDYNINAIQKTIVQENDYFLNKIEDDLGNSCTNYLKEEKFTEGNPTVKIHTEYTSHSYSFGITEADTWILHLKETYATKDPVRQPPEGKNPTPVETENIGQEYIEIQPEVEQPITDENTINSDKDVKKFIEETNTNYESKIILPDQITVTSGSDSEGKYKKINIPDSNGIIEYVMGVLFATPQDIKTIYRESTDVKGEYYLPQEIYVCTKTIPATETTKEIGTLVYRYSINENKNGYTLVTPLDPLVETKVTSLNIKELEKTDVKISKTTITTKYPADANPVKEKHFYAVDKDGNFEKFLLAYNNSEGAQNQLNSIDSWLFERMENNTATEKLVDIVKLLLYMYDGVDRGVTELDGFDDLFDTDEFNSVTRYNGTGSWWPIGSMETTTEDGKLFASGEPALGKTNISRMGLTGSAYGITVNRHPDNLGIDIEAGGKSNYYNVISIGNGVVTIVKDGIPEGRNPDANGGCGNYVEIDYGNGMKVRFLHLYAGSIKVAVGDKVTYGQVLGKIGHNGDSDGAHLHMDIKINGTAVDPTEYIDPDDPRPATMGGMPIDLYNLLLHFEGGTQYKKTEGYEVFNNGVDKRLEVTCGTTFGELPNTVFEGYVDIVGAKVEIGDIITQAQYDEIVRRHYESKKSTIDSRAAKEGITLSQAQYDGVFLLAWLAPAWAQELITEYADNGADGAKTYLDSKLTADYYQERKEVIYNLLVNETYPSY